MARSIQEIKSEIAAEFMRNESAAALYGFEQGSAFGDRFGAASVENILFYVWAVGAWAIEQLVDLHKQEISARLDRQVAHGPKWYRQKVLEFMADRQLLADTDRYDTTSMTESEIAAARVVKFAAAVENLDSGELIIKVAGNNKGKRGKLSADHELQLKAYLSEIKDAGVRLSLVNMQAEKFDCEVQVFYNAMLSPETVGNDCQAAIQDYIENLPFNGEYTNMALIDRLQQVNGVKIAELISSQVWPMNSENSRPVAIAARLTPTAGYLAPGVIKVTVTPYD